jgi:hypothetical protein
VIVDEFVFSIGHELAGPCIEEAEVPGGETGDHIARPVHSVARIVLGRLSPPLAHDGFQASALVIDLLRRQMALDCPH